MPYLQPGARILALSWDGSTPEQLAQLLTDARLRRLDDDRAGGAWAARASASAMPRRTTFAIGDIDPLNAVAIEVAAAAMRASSPLAPGLPDAFFENDGQLTKAEIRALTLSALAPRKPANCCGTSVSGAGSIGIEWMLRHPRNRCIAIEAHTERAERASPQRAASRRAGSRHPASDARRRPLPDLPAPDADLHRRRSLGSRACSRPPGLR